ncbi:MAG TPA: FecR family protein [Dongiaceae bacterium]
MPRRPSQLQRATLAMPRLITRRGFGYLTLGATATATGLISNSWLPVAAAQAQDRTQLGSVAKMQKLSGATHGTDSRSLAIGDKIYRDDLLWTRSHGQLRIDLLDGSNLSLGENAEVALDDSMLGGGGSAFMRVLSGAFRFSSGGGEKAATPPKIETPFAVLSLRGTEVYGAKFGGALGFLVTSGQVEVSNDSGSVVLNEGEGTEVSSRSSALEAPKKWGAPKVKRIKALLHY